MPSTPGPQLPGFIGCRAGRVLPRKPPFSVCHQVSTMTASPLLTTLWYTGLLRCRVAPGHGVDEVVWAVVVASGGAGDVGLTVAAVVADRRVTERGEHGGAVAGLGVVSVFTQRDVPDVVDAVLDVPLRPRPCAEIGGLGVLGGQ